MSICITKLLVLCASDHRRPYLDKVFETYKKAGYDTNFAGWDRLRMQSKAYVKKGVKCRMVFRGWGFASLKLLIGLPLWGIKLTAFLLKKHANVIHALDLDTAFPAALASIRTGIPLIYDIRDNYSLRHNWPPIVKLLIESVDHWVMRKAAAIIIVDENRLVGFLNKMSEKVTVIYNCPPDIVAPRDLDKERPFTIYASGHLTESRGIGLLIDALTFVPGAQILIAGWSMEPHLYDRIRANSSIEFVGRVSQVESLKLCFSADVVFSFYSPSSEINLRAASNKWYDAMMTGKPILTNREVLRSNWIKKNNIGYLCDYGDPKALAQVLKEIQKNPGQAKKRGDNGRRLYDREYNWRNMEKRLLKTINSSL